MNKNSFLIDLSESESTDFGRTDFSEQSGAQRVFSAVWSLESQVNNGGFSQYFESWEGDTANFAPSALRTIGAEACAQVVERALRLASPGQLPESKKEREEVMAALDDGAQTQMEALDAEFFAYPDDLTELLFSYVEAHPDDFGEIPGGRNV